MKRRGGGEGEEEEEEEEEEGERKGKAFRRDILFLASCQTLSK